MSKIITTGGGGVTSCLGMRLYGAVTYFEEHGKFPDEIDSSEQFYFYKDEQNQNISKLILGEYSKPNEKLYTSFNPGWQFAWYDQIKLAELSKLALQICPMSSAVGDKSYQYQAILDGRTVCQYRGNDKCLDIPRTHPQGMIQMAIDSGSDKFLVQTDEQDFYDFFKERFPDTICIEEIPKIKKDPDSYVMPEIGKRADFCINFLAALRAISQAPKIITNTGNTSLWMMLFRGHTDGVWQIQGQNQQWRKLN